MNRIQVFGVCHGLSKTWVNNAWVNRPAIAFFFPEPGAVPFWGIQAVRREFKTTLSKPQQLGHDGRKLGKTTVGKPQESSVKAPRGERVHLFRASWEMPKLNGCVKGRNHRTELVIFQHAIFFFAGGFYSDFMDNFHIFLGWWFQYVPVKISWDFSHTPIAWFHGNQVTLVWTDGNGIN